MPTSPSERILLLRRRLRLTQTAFAARLRVSRAVVQMWEAGTRQPGPHSRARLERLFGFRVRPTARKAASVTASEAVPAARLRRYAVILADPPWSYHDEACNGATAYQALTVETLCGLGHYIDQIAARDCALFLWGHEPHAARGAPGDRGVGFPL
jgi:transcriptional regulator with XRE-family HTH domain